MLAVVALLGAGCGLSVMGFFAGLRRQDHRVSEHPTRVLSRQVLVRVAICLVAAALVGAVTRWPVGSVLAGIAAWTLPAALGGDRHHKRLLARTEAVAMWAEMLRDNLSAAAGLEQTILVTARFAPPAIRVEIEDLAAAIRLGTRLPVALAELRDRIDDPTGQLVVRALLQASQHQSRQLAELLSEMARRARERANLRLRIAPGHARIRTNARIIVGFTVSMAVGLVVFNHGFLTPYDTMTGQLVLVIVGLIFGVGFLGIARLARVGLENQGRSS